MLTLSAQKAFSIPPGLPRTAVSVLTSGGVYGAVLLAQALDHFEAVYPLYGRFGLPWEEAEIQHLKRFLAAIRGPRLGRLKILDLPVGEIYDEDGTISARLVPGSDEPSESLRVSNRNILLVSKAAVWSAVNGIEVLAVGPVAGDEPVWESDSFLDQLHAVVKTGLGQPIQIIHPLTDLTRREVLALAHGIPLEFTFSCIRPVFEDSQSAVHCGRCHKCIERKEGFPRAGIADRTRYAAAATVAASCAS